MPHLPPFRFFRSALLLSLLFLILLQPASAQKSSSPLWPLAQEISLTDVGKCQEDIAKFRDLFAGHRIVAMGEATHGTMEFFQMKHWFFRFLVEEMGYRIFAIEGNYSEALEVNRYVREGVGDPAQAIGNMKFWTWNTREVLDLVLWMREYNQAHGPEEQVQFLGIDMQMSTDALHLLSQQLRQTDDAAAQQFIPALQQFQHRSTYKMKSAGRDSLLETAEAIYQWLVTDSVKLSQAWGAELFFESKMHARVLTQCASMHGSTFNHRDSCMADNVKYLLDHAGPEARMMIWAHNGHIVKQSQYEFNGKLKTLGTWLNAMYGDSYYTIGFDCGGGTLAAVGRNHVGTHTLTKFRKGNLRSHFMNHPAEAVYINMQPSEPSAKVAKALAKLKGVVHVGALFDPRYEMFYRARSSPALQFDAVIFIKHTHAAVPLWGTPAASAGIRHLNRFDSKTWGEVRFTLTGEVKVHSVDHHGFAEVRMVFIKGRHPRARSAPYAKTYRTAGDWQPFTLEATSPNRWFGWSLSTFIRGAAVAEFRNFKLEIETEGQTSTVSLPAFADWDKGAWELYQHGLETEVGPDGSIRMSWKTQK